MSEKILHEMRIVETEDGFRIEIKGDKEKLRKMLEDGMFPFGPRRMPRPGPHFIRGDRSGRGPGGGAWRAHNRRHGHHGGHGHGHGHHGHHHEEEHEGRAWGKAKRRFARYDLGPWFDDDPDGESQKGTEL